MIRIRISLQMAEGRVRMGNLDCVHDILIADGRKPLVLKLDSSGTVVDCFELNDTESFNGLINELAPGMLDVVERIQLGD